jgi:hypothetical protein
MNFRPVFWIIKGAYGVYIMFDSGPNEAINLFLNFPDPSSRTRSWGLLSL